eukprot:maker-scaffold168_size293125-snap-gene-1.75 protein:Tk04470 transcript:maker-scaffold168_size293125-snap-gene-1.75-mRNA-1 annotation:"exocyst complex component 5"
MAMHAMVHWPELEQEPYDPEEFVERLAWRTTGQGVPLSGGVAGTGLNGHLPGVEPFDATSLQLHDAFVQAIKDLTFMHETQTKKCQLLEQKCREEEQSHWKRIAVLIERNRSAAFIYKSLDEKITSVATKVVHLGDQLESVNTPRARDVEALKLMKHFDEFLGGEANLSPVFNDKSRLHEAADIILKLQLIVQELPNKKFVTAVEGIECKYSEIERTLNEEFAKSHRSNDIARMKDIAFLLANFNGYNRCIDDFIEHIQLQQYRGQDIFRDIVPLCQSSWDLIRQVFPNPEQVMSKFVLNIFHHKLNEHLATKLADQSNMEVHLNNLSSLFAQTMQLAKQLSPYNFGTDHKFLANLTKKIFQSYLSTYIANECRYLNEKCTIILQRYYQGLGHQKKHLSTGSEKLYDLKRDIQGLIASKANINLDTSVSYGGETFLSEEVAINILQLTKSAFKRCKSLSNESELPSNTLEILGLLISYLLHEHIDYAVDLGLHGIPMPEVKTIPELYFFDLVGQTNTMIHLLEKQLSDSVIPLVEGSSKHRDCIELKRSELEKIEAKLDIGLDRSLNSIVGWVKTILQQEQKKSDFNPLSNDVELATTSPACMRAVKFINHQVAKIRETLDGKNIEAILQELGTRLHRVIYEHLTQFQFNSSGAMVVICDVQDYRKCASHFKVGVVNALFDTLHAMCNLLILPLENLGDAIQGDQLATLDKTVIEGWIQLRADSRNERLVLTKR